MNSHLVHVGQFSHTAQTVFKVLSFTEEISFCSCTKVWASLGWQKLVTDSFACMCVCMCVHLETLSHWNGFSFLFPVKVCSDDCNVMKCRKLKHKNVRTLVLNVSYCNSADDEWAAHYNWPHLPWWRGSFQNSGQSLISLPVCVSQPYLQKPDAYQMLNFTRPCTFSPTGLGHATLCSTSWIIKYTLTKQPPSNINSALHD